MRWLASRRGLASQDSLVWHALPTSPGSANLAPTRLVRGHFCDIQRYRWMAKKRSGCLPRKMQLYRSMVVLEDGTATPHKQALRYCVPTRVVPCNTRQGRRWRITCLGASWSLMTSFGLRVAAKEGVEANEAGTSKDETPRQDISPCEQASSPS